MYLMEKALHIKKLMFLLSCHSVTFIDSLSLPSPPQHSTHAEKQQATEPAATAKR